MEITPEITDAEINEFIDHGGDAPSYHPVLEVWREVLRPAAKEMVSRVTPGWANKIIQTYPEITYAKMDAFRGSYFAKIIELLTILNLEISSDPDCLTYHTPEEDVEHNTYHYKNLLLQWQQAILQWELDWETTHEDAAVEVAAIAEVHKMFFGPTGITAFLDNIKFEFTEHDQALLAAALEEFKEGK